MPVCIILVIEESIQQPSSPMVDPEYKSWLEFSELPTTSYSIFVTLKNTISLVRGIRL